MKFYIPSYKRAGDVLTIKYLHSCGVPANDITIATQTQDDYKAYQAMYSHACNVIYRQGDNVAMNRNTCILDARAKGVSRFIMLDDDVRAIECFLPKRGTLIDNADSFAQFTSQVEQLLVRGAFLVGLYPITNNMFALNQKPLSRALLTGAFMAFGGNDFLFNEDYRIKEDYELCCRLMQAGRAVVRLNRYCYRVRLKSNRGGCSADFRAGLSEHFTNELLFMYPDLLKKGCRRGEIGLR